MGVDVGSARIGVASCDPDGLLASPLLTVPRGVADLDTLAGIAVQYGVIEIVVGLPTGLSGREGRAAAGARLFAAALAARVGPVPVRMLDERFTTAIAHDVLQRGGRNSRQRRPIVDRAAAALLLQTALDSERRTGMPAGELVDASLRGRR
jgi:putative holliday junction resolvase